MSYYSQVSSGTFTLVWRIENLSSLTEFSDECVTSARCKSQSLHGSSWSLSLKLNSILHGTDYLYMSLSYLKPNDARSHLFDFEYSYLDLNEDPIWVISVENCDFSERTTHGLPVGLTQQEVFITERSKFLPNDTLTVRIRLWKSEDQMSHIDDEYCVTRSWIGLGRACTTWQIERFSFLDENYIGTNSVHIVDYGTFTLKFSLEGESLQSSLLNLEVISDFNNHCVFCTISILDPKQKILTVLLERYKCDTPYPYTIPNSLARRDILNKRTQFLKQDDLSLLLEFEVLYYREVVTTIRYRLADMERSTLNILPETDRRALRDGEDYLNTKQQKDCMTVLSEDFLSLYREETLCDFELRCGDISFPVHRLILSARSPVFKAMLSIRMKEADSKSYDVPDLEPDTLDRMLTFFYGATLEPDLNAEYAAKLYYAAVKYQVRSLKKQCSFVIKSDISTSNVCDILLLADKHGDDRLKSVAQKFLFTYSKEVISSPEWRNFQDKNLQLAAATMQFLLERATLMK